MHACPRCQAQVQVPLVKQAGSGKIVALVLGLVTVLVGCPMIIVVCLAAIQILGANSNKAFGTVGQSIGAVSTNRQ